MRRTKEEAEETRQKIIQACYDVIREKGYDKMTKDDIAKKLGMTRGAVNWHFKDKEELYLVTLEYILEELRKQREYCFEQKEMNIEDKLLRLFKMPIEEADYFHFINRIPHYLLTKDSFKGIEEKKQKNRQFFIKKMEEWMLDYEKEHQKTLKNSKKIMAHMLYLLYEGLHNRNTKEEYVEVDFLKELKEYFQVIIQ